GKVDAPNLINPVDDLEQSVPMVELRLPPEAGIDRVGRRSFEERIILLAPDHFAVRSGHKRVGQRSDEAARGILKVVLSVTRERREDGIVQSLDGRLRWLLLTDSRAGGLDAESDDCKKRAATEPTQHAYQLGHFLFPASVQVNLKRGAIDATSDTFVPVV